MKNAVQMALLDIGSEAVTLEDPEEKGILDRARESYPQLVKALADYRAVYASHVDAYRRLCDEIRKTDCRGRALTALLIGEGWQKAKASQFRSLIEAPEPVFNAYMSKLIGFHAALQAAREGRSVALPVATGRAYDAVVNALNQVDVGVFVMKTSTFKVERLGVVYTLRVRRKAQKAGRKAGKGAKKGKSHAAKS
jgi:hypothetical protein